MPRKPQQSRSKATVQAILEGALRCMQREGFDRLTTKSIADYGGVSVGSVYEYFGSKEDIIDALFVNMVESIAGMIEQNRDRLLDLPLDEMVETLLQLFGELLERNDKAFFCLAQHLLQRDTDKYTEPVRDSLQQFVLAYLMRNPNYLRTKELEVMVFIMINSGIFVVLRQISGAGKSVTLQQIGRGFGKLIRHYADNEIA